MTINRPSIDIFAETNPAFCSLIIHHFCRGYYFETKCGVPFPLLILPLPIILSKELEKSFLGTNAKTGFFKWIENNPEIILELTERINGSREFLKPAIEFGIFKKIFQINDSGLLVVIEANLNKNKNVELETLFKHSEKFGKWIGQVNSTKTIFNHLGIQL